MKKIICKITLLFVLSLISINCSKEEKNENLENSDNQETFQRNVNLSGIDLYKSIFFGIGSFAQNIPQLRNQAELVNTLTNSRRSELLSRLDLLILEINSKYPSFFSDFKLKINSGNHSLIKSAIDEGSNITKENIEVIFPEFKKVINKVKADFYTGKLKLNQDDNLNQYIKEIETAYDNGEYEELLNENMISDNDSALVPCTWAIACVLYFVGAIHNTIAITAVFYFKFAFKGPSLDERGQEIGSRRPTTEQEDLLKTETLINEIAEYYYVN